VGLVNASSTLQRIVDIVLSGAQHYANKLLDDILVWTSDFSQHLMRLADVLNRLMR